MLTLNADDPSPWYRQLYGQLREQILTGKLPADSRLPSVRDLVRELSVSRNTVEGAFQELLAEGYIYSKPRSGYFVSRLHQESAPAAPSPAPGREAVPQVTIRYRYDFHPARLDPESFPADLWRKCYLASLRESSRELSLYRDPQGEWGLRQSIRHYLERSRGVVCDPEQIVVTAGLQQGLELVAQLLRKTSPVVALEEPGYFLPRTLFRNHGFPVIPIAVGPTGLELDLLKGCAATVVYVTPSHQLPAGCVMPLASRLKLIDWADSGDRFIIEDDYDSELRYHGKPIPSLQSLRPAGNVIYAGTFSKILSPALRLSYLVLPPALLDALRRQMRDYFPTVSYLEQETLTKFIEQGHWERHVRRMRMMYQKKHDSMLRSLARHFAARAVVTGQGAGLHVVVELPDVSIGEEEIVERARASGIRLFPASSFYDIGSPKVTTLLLGFGSLSGDEIDEGVAHLAGVCF